jgi:outer membrane protein OmpA-like peptidoglycan-associated protein
MYPMRMLAGSAVLAGLALPALAQTPSNVYIAPRGGVVMQSESDYSGSGGNSAKVKFKTGFAAGAALGYDWKPIRTELEVMYRQNDVDSVNGTALTSGSGKNSSIAGMINVLYDFNLSSAWKPYVGVGIGAARVTGELSTSDATRTFDNSSNKFAYQGIVGVGYQINPSVDLTLDYRYMATQNPSFTTSSGRTLEGEYKTHTVMLGVTFRLPASAPPPPTQTVAPAALISPPPPPRAYLVFFDFNKSDITPQAATVIREAADMAKRTGTVRLMLTGHADRVGAPGYNQKLSEKRADAVRRALVAEGINEQAIAVGARGETQNLVPTADQVKEAENRRVEIVLQ